MISIQRFLNSPTGIYTSSAPPSPTATRRSRSPSPLSKSYAETSRARRNGSKSPDGAIAGTPASTAATVCRSKDLPQQLSIHQRTASASKRPVIEQKVALLTESASSDLTEGLGTIESPHSGPVDTPRLGRNHFAHSLLSDLSLYKNPIPIPENDGRTLEELAHLVRLSKYQERKRANTRISLQRSLVSTALSARLMRCGEMVHRNLVDCFRSGDKKSFAALYNAAIDVRKSCDEVRRFALLEPDMDLLQSTVIASTDNLETPTGSVAAGSATNAAAPFLNDISASAREAFLSFLSQIRTNPDFLAARLTSLSTAEFSALRSFHQTMEPLESVLPFHNVTNRPSGRATSTNAISNARVSVPERSAIEKLLSFQRHDPISALIHTCFANSAGPESAEDKRRTSIWATACARLVSSTATGSDHLVMAVLNVWISMRDWSGKSNMEWYLMKILEDGAFLLDRPEDQRSIRFKLTGITAKDQISEEEFYTRSIEDLFDMLGDEDGIGIPDGLIELGNEILKRLDKKLVEPVRKWLVANYLFSTWLISVIIHPEACGMMAEYHITEYGRQKILKQVAVQAQRYVVDYLYKARPVSILSKIEAHIDHMMSRFNENKFGKKPRLLPARSITSLRETAEVRPYLVISPADLDTLITALFPERRPPSAHSGSLRSGAPCTSGLVIPPIQARSPPTSVFDGGSVVSTSLGSSFSDATTSRDAAMDDQLEGSPSRLSPPVAEGPGPVNYEEEGFRLRLAMHEMVRTLGAEAVSGCCHPCAERWAVVFISSDGKHLSTQMTYDPDDEMDEDDFHSSSSEVEDEETENERPELDRDYHQLRDSILRLVQDFEIPQDLESQGGKAQTFSNRASGLQKYRIKNGIITTGTTMASRNPYRKLTHAVSNASLISLSTSLESPMRKTKGKEVAPAKEEDDKSDSSSILIAMLEAASSQSRAQSDFVSAHLYWKTLQQLKSLSSESLRKNGFATLLNIFSRGPHDLIRRSAAAIEEYDAWLVWLKQSQERAEGLIESMMRRLRALRDKMWYVTDVRNSAPYEDSRNIAVALKTMGMPQQWDELERVRGSTQRGRASNYIYRTEVQVLELLAASEPQGGPNKLTDDQADRTLRWLQSNAIENFCPGEERIHRFCCEVHICINKLVGDSIVDGPVLWSSELYSRDRRILEGNRPARDRDGPSWDESVSIVSGHTVTSEPEQRYGSLGRSSGRQLQNISLQNMSQASFDSSHYKFSRASTVMSDPTDSTEYFGVSSQMHTADTSNTFWSPFRRNATSPPPNLSRAHSPVTSPTSLSGSYADSNHVRHPSQSYPPTGQGTSLASIETAYQQRLSEEKTRFLTELRQTLTSLLLSDLGTLVWAQGSETDTWFGALGQECIDRREEIQRRARESAAAKEKKRLAKTLGVKQRLMEKKRSSGDLRAAGNVDAEGDHESTETSDTVRGKRLFPQLARPDDTGDFPLIRSYQRLLSMFSVHPNPYAKLGALHELNQLIIASRSTRRSRSGCGRSDSAAASSQSEDATIVSASRMQSLEEMMENVRGRRSQSLMQSSSFPSGRQGATETRSIAAIIHSPNTDVIVNVLQALFRDRELRPKTLFRDLQFVASFVASNMLDKTERGKAFWDTGLAALGLKQEICKTMVEVADDIVKNYTEARSRGPRVFGAEPVQAGEASPALISPPLPHSTDILADAARLWTITAKEGDPTAQRELAIFYLGNPELVERTTLPLSKPGDVFKQSVMQKYGGGAVGDEGVGGLNARTDPALMCMAMHWMEEADRGGDEVARQFVSQQSEGSGMLG